MTPRFFELAVRARRLVARNVSGSRRGPRVTARRQLGELTQFSFRLALVIDLTYVGMGALGGAALDRARMHNSRPTGSFAAGACADSTADRRPAVSPPTPPFAAPLQRESRLPTGAR